MQCNVKDELNFKIEEMNYLIYSEIINIAAKSKFLSAKSEFCKKNSDSKAIQIYATTTKFSLHVFGKMLDLCFLVFDLKGKQI